MTNFGRGCPHAPWTHLVDSEQPRGFSGHDPALKGSSEIRANGSAYGVAEAMWGAHSAFKAATSHDPKSLDFCPDPGLV